MDLAVLLRTGGLVAGPAAVLAFASFVAAMVTAGESALETSPLAIASSALLLVAALGIAAVAVGVLARLREKGLTSGGPAVAAVGSALVVGGVWAILFVMHPLAAESPEALENEVAGIVVGYVASYLVFAVGWAWTGVALLRARALPTWQAVFVTVAGVLAFVPSPEPARLLLIAIAVSLAARRLTASAGTVAREAVPA